MNKVNESTIKMTAGFKLKRALCLFVLFLVSVNIYGNDFASDISEIKKRIEKLPELTPQESGAPMGFKSDWINNKNRSRFVTVDLGKVYPLEEIILVPALEPAPEGSKAHYFPKHLKVSTSINEDSDFIDQHEYYRDDFEMDNPLPVIFKLQEIKARYVKIDLLNFHSHNYYALGEIFVFSNGRNVALNKSISTDCKPKPAGKTDYLVDGLTSLGMPIIRAEINSSQHLWIGSILSNHQFATFEFAFKNYKKIDEIRIYNTWLPNSSRPENIPGKFQFFYFDENELKWQSFFNKKRNSVFVVGDNPLSLQFEPVQSKKFRIEFYPVSDQKNDCSISEIELIDWNENIAPQAEISFSLDVKNRTRVEGQIDGSLRYGKLIPQQKWLNDIVLRDKLEKELTELNLKQEERNAYFISLYKNIAYIISALLIVSLVMVFRNRIKFHRHQEQLRREIASDLHDEIGSNLACINLISEYLNQEKVSSDDLKENAREIMNITNETNAIMHDIVWMLDPNRKDQQEFKKHLEEIAQRLLRNIDTKIEFINFERIESWSIDLVRNLILFYKEALNNLQKYSKAKEVKISMGFRHKVFFLTIEDNGSVPLKKAAPSLYSRADKLDWDFKISHTENNTNKLSLRIRSTRLHG